MEIVSCPSMLETVHLMWLACSRKWWCSLTDFEWGVKEPLSLRTMCSLTVTALSVPIDYRPISGTAMKIIISCFLVLALV